MRILHLIQRYWPAHGGAEIHFHELASRLAADGHHVTVVTTDALDFELFWEPGAQRVQTRRDTHERVSIRRFPVRHMPAAPVLYPAWRRLLWLLSRSQVVPTAVLHRLARYTPRLPHLWHWIDTTDTSFDLVAGMTICFEPILHAGLHLARRQGIPFVVYPLTHLGAGRRPGDDALSRFYTMRHQVDIVQRSNAVVAQTSTERDFYTERGVPAEHIIVAGPGTNPEQVLGGDGTRFRHRHNIRGPLVVSLAAMSYEKGTIHLVEAVRRLWRRGYTVELALGGAVLTQFRRYLDGLPTPDRERLHVLGHLDECKKRDMLAAADVYAMPSRSDSFGITYLEAWLYRTPVIGAQTWGVRDVISDGEDGLLVPFGDVPALAAAIARLLEQPEQREALGRRGERKVYRQHTWARTYRRVRDLYEQLAGSAT